MNRRTLVLALLGLLGSFVVLPVTPSRAGIEYCNRDLYPATKLGTSGDNTLRGTPQRDVIHGRGGNDTIRGFERVDILCGNDGHDVLIGGRGGDRLHGGNGNDDLFGGDGADELKGEAGEDNGYGGSGEDFLYDVTGRDDYFGQGGDDELRVFDNEPSSGDFIDGGSHTAGDSCDFDASDIVIGCEFI